MKISCSFHLVALLAFGVLAGCVADVAPEVSIAPSNVELRELAHRYLYERHNTEEENQHLLAEIESLSADDSHRFFIMVDLVQSETVGVLNEEESRMREMSRVLNDYAYDHGISLLQLTREQVNEALVAYYDLGQDVLERLNSEENNAPRPDAPEDDGSNGTTTVVAPICYYPYVACNTLSYTSTAWGASCGFGCIDGYANDRYSNSVCEELACDHRILYPSASLRTAVSGESAAAQCVINHWGGGIESRWSGGYTQLGFGVSGPAACYIWWDVGPYLRDYTQVF